MPNVFYTSDLHFGHKKVSELRGFATTDAHDDSIREKWNAQVGKDDVVWILGDLAASSPTEALAILADLPGRKHLVAGNHDKCHPMYRDAQRWQRIYLEVFDSVQPFARRKIDGRTVLLSHFPYEEDRGTPRYMQYRLADHGEWLIHGHLHEPWRATTSYEMHVGWDAWGRLAKQEEIIALMDSLASGEYRFGPRD